MSELIEKYLTATGQTLEYLMLGEKQYGLPLIEGKIIPLALHFKCKIIWEHILIKDEDVGLYQWRFEKIDPDAMEGEEVIVANIIGDHYWGEQKEIKSGTKHFRPGAKVYCVFMYGGMGHHHVRVFGKPRKSFRMIDVVIARSFLKNFRVQKTYSPQVIAFLKKYPYYTNAEIIHTGVDWLNETPNSEIIEDNSAGN